MWCIEQENIGEAFEAAIGTLLDEGEEVVIKGNTTLELHPCTIVINNAKQRTLIYPHRGNNPFSTLFETMWVLSGNNDIKDLKFFLPRAGDFSDDDISWRAGYGTRIFRHLGINGEYASGMVHGSAKPTDWQTIPHEAVDQFKYVYDTLLADPTSRQAVITLWDPAKECTVGKSKDFPCSNYVSFLIRDGKLNCMLNMRSNDILWGFSSINVYEFTVMQEILANMLGVEVGKYYHVANSFHCYTKGGFNAEKNFEKLQRCQTQYDKVVAHLPTEEFKAGDTYEETMQCYRNIYERTCRMINLGRHQFVREVQSRRLEANSMEPIETYLYLYVLWKRKDLLTTITFDEIYEHHMNCLPLTDLKLSCHYWFMKQWKLIKTTEIDVALTNVKLYNKQGE